MDSKMSLSCFKRVATFERASVKVRQRIFCAVVGGLVSTSATAGGLPISTLQIRSLPCHPFRATSTHLRRHAENASAALSNLPRRKEKRQIRLGIVSVHKSG